MAIENNNEKKALLIVDVQNGVIASSYNTDQVIENIRTLIAKARTSKAPIIWVQHCSDDLQEHTNKWQIDPRLEQSKDDFYIQKRYNSSFEKTELDDLFKRLEVKKIVLVGAATNWCIRATAYATLERGYDLCLISDAHTTESLEYADGVVIEAKDIILELNTAIKWLEYPDRNNETQTAVQFEF